MTKELSHVMLELHNVKMELLNARKNMGTIKYDKRIVTCYSNATKKIVICDIRTAQCKNGTIKCEKKIRKPSNVTKELLHVMLELHNMKMESLNMMF